MSEAVDYLLTIPMFQQVGASALNPSLDKIGEIDLRLGHPHQNFKTIHVGGTNGKGSVSHMLCSVLMAAGYRVGLYTSPHLKTFHERIRVNGEMIDDGSIEKFVAKTKSTIEELKPSFFEITTALAFSYFSEQKVDIALIEVGLGGCFDATNIITPVLSVITNISKDHTSILGNTIAEIAKQKAGIIKQNVPTIIGESNAESDTVFQRTAMEMKCEIIFADKLYKLKSSTIIGGFRFFEIENDKQKSVSLMCELTGRAQNKNILTLFAACKVLGINQSFIEKGLEICATSTNLLGRWQTISQSPLTICDTAHNEAGIEEVTEQLKTLNYNKLYVILGMVSDKDVNSVLKLLPKDAYYIFTKAQITRALNEEELKNRAIKFGLLGECSSDTKSALCRAQELAGGDDVIFIGGSNFIVSELI